MRLMAALVLLAAAPAAAQDTTALLACAGVAADVDRLACFDREMARASPEARAANEKRAAAAAVAAKAKVEADAAAAKAKAEADAVAQRDSFGAENVASRPERFAPLPGEVQEVETGLTEILTNTSGLGVFLLENGQLWRQVDTGRLPNIRPGDRVKLTRASLGGYHLNFLKQKRWVLVKRMK